MRQRLQRAPIREQRVQQARELLRRGQCDGDTCRLAPGASLDPISADILRHQCDERPGNILHYRDELDEDGLSTMQRAGPVSCESGATAVEFALVLPSFLMLFLGILSACLAVFAAASLHYAAEGAARCYSVNSTPCSTATSTQCCTATATQSYAQSLYHGPNSPTFLASTATCGFQVSGLGGEAHRSGEGDDQRHHASLIAKKSAQARLCSLRRYEKVPRAKLRRPEPKATVNKRAIQACRPKKYIAKMHIER